MPISGKEMLKRYLADGWVAVRQKGSHVRVKKGTLRETIPIHSELKIGTERYLLKKLGKKDEV